MAGKVSLLPHIGVSVFCCDVYGNFQSDRDYYIPMRRSRSLSLHRRKCDILFLLHFCWRFLLPFRKRSVQLTALSVRDVDNWIFILATTYPLLC